MDYTKVDGPSVPIVNPDLLKERNTATFSTLELTNFIDGDKAATERRRQILTTFFKNPVFSGLEKYFQSPSERYDRALEKAVTLFKMSMENGWDIEVMKMLLGAIQYDIPILGHAVMFIPLIERLGTDAQKAHWLPLAMSFQVIGSYVQTEMAHGTNLKNLLTTATYDRKSKEFIVNTPLPDGMKYWPGSLGKTANHAAVMAELVVDGQRHGMQAYIVPIRDMVSHHPLPGVEVGEMGTKIGLHTADNGYLILRNVRIPRDNMLMKYNQVTPEGLVLAQTNSKVNYGTMMLVRANIVRSAFQQLSMAVTIATRYSAVRRQSELKPGAPEVQILDFQTQQYKLLPSIALSYALMFAKDYMLRSYDTIYKEELSQGNFDSLPELHSQSSGLKALCTDLSCEAIEVCRRSCGGHGYLLASGVCTLYTDALAGVTYEGENTVLYLQTASTYLPLWCSLTSSRMITEVKQHWAWYLMKSFAASQSGETLTWSVKYLSAVPELKTPTHKDDLFNLKTLAQACKRRAYYVVEKVATRLQSCIESGTPHYLAWNENSVQLVTAAKAHIDSFLCLNFIECVDQLTCSPALRRVLISLCQLHVIHRMLENASHFLESGALTFNQLDILRVQETVLLANLRPDAVGLVDAFDWRDETLCSVLGRHDGYVYQALYESSKLSELNKTQVHSGHEKHIKPFQEMSKL